MTSPALPPAVGYGRVTGKIVAAIPDGSDVGSLPDAATIPGLAITFTARADRVTVADTIVLPRPVRASFDSTGALYSREGAFVDLVATDVAMTTPWTWNASVTAPGMRGWDFDFNLPSGAVRDLSTMSPIAVSEGVAVTKGEDGRTAYQVWLDAGNTGTVADFVADGPYRAWLQAGNTGTRQDYLDSLKSTVPGPAGGSDAATASWITNGTETPAALTTKLGADPYKPRHIKTYVVGDGVTNDTAALQGAIDAAIAGKFPLYSDPSVTILTDQIAVTGALTLTGTWTLTARTTGQTSLLSITSKVDFSAAHITLNCAGKAQYGIKASGFGRSTFGNVTASSATLWGWQFDPTGNNNLVRVGKLTAQSCGVKSAQTLTETAETANVNTSTTGYGTFTLSAPLAAAPAESIYWVYANGRPYRVKSATATTLEVYNLAAGVGNSISATVYVGGGLNVPGWGDNGVGTWGSLDVQNCAVGIQHNPLYGHDITNAVLQANGIGLSTYTYTMNASITKPYFELNDVDVAIGQYISGSITTPTLDVSRVWNSNNAVLGNPHADPRLQIIQDKIPTIVAGDPPAVNQGSRTLTPGMFYAYHKTAGSHSFTINNTAGQDATGALGCVVMLTGSASTTIPVTVLLANATVGGVAQTIEGGSSWTTNVTGRVLLVVHKVGSDWKAFVTTPRDPATAITAAPAYVGQTAVVGGVGYMATGTASTADWKQITN